MYGHRTQHLISERHVLIPCPVLNTVSMITLFSIIIWKYVQALPMFCSGKVNQTGVKCVNQFHVTEVFVPDSLIVASVNQSPRDEWTIQVGIFPSSVSCMPVRTDWVQTRSCILNIQNNLEYYFKSPLKLIPRLKK